MAEEEVKRSRRLTEAQTKRLLALYRKGISCKDIGAQLGVLSARVSAVAIKNGLRRHRTAAPYRRDDSHGQQQRQQLLQLEPLPLQEAPRRVAPQQSPVEQLAQALEQLVRAMPDVTAISWRRDSGEVVLVREQRQALHLRR